MSDRLALIIASYEYQDPDLRQLVAPAQDAEALARVLKDPAIGGFEVQTLLNAPAHEVNQTVEAFFVDRKRDDLLLLYFSSHGVKDEDGQLCFATTQTRRKLLRSTAVSANFVNDEMRRSRSRQQVLLLDCCYSGAFAKGMLAKAGAEIGTRERFKGRGRVVLTASDAMQYAFEEDAVQGEGARSVFTRSVVCGLETGEADRDGDGLVSLDELYEYVHDRVTDETPHQRPGKWNFGIEGQIIIARNPHPVVKSAELPRELREALQSTVVWTRLGAVSELGRLLQGSDEGLALAARKALERLVDDDSRRVSASATQALGAVQADVPAKPPPMAPAIVQPEPESPPGVLTITTPIHLELVRVPAGEFLMGSDPAKDKKARDDEQSQHSVQVSEFYIGKAPLTNVQYAAFVKATNRKAPKHWKRLLGLGQDNIPAGKENHPVVHVSWHDAVAFCEWLSRETGKSFRLPTEAEWEKAARGTDGRIHPWGDVFDAKQCNTRESGTHGTTSVGQYSPGGDSPYGCADMAGNVWEWTSSLLKDYPYDPADGREDMKAGGDRVLRGGSFIRNEWDARSAFRYCFVPGYRFRDFGVRVGVGAAAPFSHLSKRACP